MAAPPAILCKPATLSAAIVCSHLPRVNSLKIVPVLEFPSPKFLFSEESVSQRPGLRYKRTWSPNTKTDSISTSAMESSTGDEDVTSFEQESFLDGSSEFPPKFNLVGFESALNLLSKWLVTALFGAVLLWRHDAEALWAAMGSVVNAGLSTILKQVLNQERPFSNLRSDPGMPSSHAQSIFFAVIFIVILMVQWLGVNELSLTLSGLALALGSYLSWLRVSQRLHTISQVVVGAVLGSVFAILWFWLWEAIVLEAFVSYLWVRIIVLLVAGGFCVGFLIYVIRYWIMKEK